MPSGKPIEPADDTTRGKTEVLPPIRWRASAEGDSVWFSPEWAALTGQGSEQSRGVGWLDYVHPDDRGRVLKGWHSAQTQRSFAADLRVRAAQDGRYRWFRAHALPSDGGVPGWVGSAVDISDLQDAVADESAARAALQHRVRNTLAVIRSIARRTAESSETVEDYRSHFDGRLAAFSRTQSHIMRSGRKGVDLEGLLADELLAHRVGGLVSYAGPEVRLPARIADQLGIALHELTANAIQHGALRPDRGRLTVRWWISGDPPDRRLHLDWQEEVPDGGIVPPHGEGFGLELLTRSLRYELDAEVEFAFADQGMTCRIQLNLE
ncbi:MAG: PAS domain-containing protein [Sphingomonas taxi]